MVKLGNNREQFAGFRWYKPQFETARSDRVFEVTIDKTDKLSIEIPEHLYQSNSEINADFIASNKVYINRELIGSEYLFVLRNIGFAQILWSIISG